MSLFNRIAQAITSPGEAVPERVERTSTVPEVSESLKTQIETRLRAFQLGDWTDKDIPADLLIHLNEAMGLDESSRTYPLQLEILLSDGQKIILTKTRLGDTGTIQILGKDQSEIFSGFVPMYSLTTGVSMYQ